MSQLGTLPALANDSTQAADRHFTRGLSAAGAGKMALAASEFERAYEAVPHYSVLYNLGLVYSSLGRNADAVRVLGRYLSDGGEQVSERRRKEVARIISERSVGLSHLRVQIEPEGATVTLDARTLAPAELDAPTPIDPGRHLLSVRRDGYETAVLPFDVAASETANLEVRLTELTRPEPALEKVALLARCSVPDVELSIDGEVTARWSPDVPHVVTSGPHRIRFARPGYDADDYEVEVRGGERIECRMRPLAPLPSTAAATLQVIAPSRARVLVDGVAFSGGTVPAGRHRVTVLHEDYSTWQREVEMPQGRITRLEPALVATPESVRREESIDQRRTWALISGGAGLALLATGVGLYVFNGERYEAWQKDNAAFSENQDASPFELKQEASDLRGRAASIQQLDDIALGLGVLGAVSMGAGVALYLSAPTSADGAPLRATLAPRGLEFSGAW